MSDGRCRLCGGDVSAAFTAVDSNRRVSAERFTYGRCEVCGSLSLTTVPSDLARYYPREYYALPQDRAALRAASVGEHHKLEILRPFSGAGRLIEVGPGIGGFTLAASEAGYDTSVIDMDPEVCHYLRDTIGVEVHETARPEVALTAHAPFDVVAMWQVIEHLPDPRAVLAAAADSLAPGGIIAVAAPNPQSLQLRLFGGRWAHVDAPRHLCLMPAAALARLASPLGLEVAMLTMRDPDALGWNRFGWRETLAAQSRRSAARSVLRVTGSLLARAAAPLERRGQNGATYTLVLRRPAAAPPPY